MDNHRAGGRQQPAAPSSSPTPSSPATGMAPASVHAASVTAAAVAAAEALIPPPARAKRGFAVLSPEKKREIASMGGKAAHQHGRAHRFTSEEARAAGKKRHQLRVLAAQAAQQAKAAGEGGGGGGSGGGGQTGGA